MDISNFFIQTDLKDFQYIKYYINMNPQEIIDEYNLYSIVEPDG